MENNEINILLVEDNPGDARLVSEMLKGSASLSFRLAHAGLIGEALKMLGQEKFDIVLLDLNLPDSYKLDGLERIVAHVPVIPVIVLTSLNDETTGLNLVQKHAADYLVKGQINTNILARSVRYAIERKKKEEELRKLNRTLKALSDSSLAMTRVNEESDYLNEVCRIVVNDCGYSLVWIGFVEHDENKSVRPVAQAGFEIDYTKTLNITWADTERGRGPTGTAVRTGKVVICKDILTDPDFTPWRKDALKRGYASSIVLPLIYNGKTLGAVSIYSKETDPFSGEEIKLLTELSHDLAYGIAVIREVGKRKQAEDALKQAYAELETKVEQRTSALFELNKQLGDEMLARKEKEKYIHARSVILDLIMKKTSRKDFLEALLQQLLNWTGCRHGGIRVLNEKGYIPYEAHAGFDKEFIRKENYLSVISDHCACIRAVNQKFEPQDKVCTTQFGSFYTNNSAEFVKSLSEKEIDRFRGLCIKRGYASIAVIPVRYKEKVVAAIHLADEASGKIPKETVDFIEHIATIVGEGINTFDLQERVRQGYINQGIINSLLRLSLTEVAIEEILQKTLTILLSIKWLQFEKKGNIFLVEGEPDKLVLKAQQGLHPYLQKKCSRVEFGKCICGKAALSKKIEFIDSNSSAHEIRYREMKPHSHYCAPIVSPIGMILGVINIYLTSTYIKDRRKDEFLASIANVLGTIIENKKTQEELRKVQNDLATAKRLSDIGTLAATIAHELRNPLAAIRMAAHNIKRKAGNPALDSHFGNIEKKISESDQIISNLLFYSRIKSSHFENINLYEVIDESMALAKNRFRERKVKVKKEIKPLKDVLIEADSLQMKELFANVVNNAYDALPDSGGRIEVCAELNGDDTVRVRIKDSGCGIDKGDLNRIFDPFFTTKSKGTGLGLSVCYQIINLHHGKINVESEKGKGTTISVILPLKPR